MKKEDRLATKRIGVRNFGVLAFGIILLLVGLVASFYQEDVYGTLIVRYPYQEFGIVLVVAGIAFIAIGFFYPP